MSTPYPDPVSPRCDPDLLGRVDYDPFGVMIARYSRRPHVWTSADRLERIRARVRRGGYDRLCQAWLLEKCLDRNGVLTRPLAADAESKIKMEILSLATRNALACNLEPDKIRRETALKAFRRLAEYGVKNPVSSRGGLVANGSLSESHALKQVGVTYDLLAALDLSARDDRLFRSFLMATQAASNACDHYACGNHNTWSQVGRLSIGLALENAQIVHDALYGCAGGARWRYGLIHQFRHDILSDGMHWERTMGYHFYTLMGLTYAMDFLANSGRDLWHYAFPTLKQDDLFDAHREYGPHGTKTLQAAYDAPFRMLFGNGDLSLLSDSGLANLRGTWIWGLIYDKAYEAYRQPHYAWLLNKMEKDYPKRERPGIPMPLQTHRGDLDFVRLEYDRYPAGRFSFAGRGRVGLTGVQQKASSLAPAFGGAVMRADAGRQAPAAYLYYGPHIAGHQHPAGLHVDIHIAGQRLTDAARLAGYDDPLYLTWGRTTVAANTVVVDRKSMFPYDFPTESIWECDLWRDSISNGELRLFQTDPGCNAVRAINQNVYPGVRLDRTVVASDAGVLDVYRVVADQIRDFDYIFHCTGRIPIPAGSKPIRLGSARGYQHLTRAQCLRPGMPPELTWQTGKETGRCVFAELPGARLILAREPESDPKPGGRSLGELEFDPARTTVLQRVRGRAVVFASFWAVGADPVAIQRVRGRAEGDLSVTVKNGRHSLRWDLPETGAVRFCREAAPRK